MTVAQIAQQVQLRVEDKDGVIFSQADIAKGIDSANQRIGAYLDKKYLTINMNLLLTILCKWQLTQRLL